MGDMADDYDYLLHDDDDGPSPAAYFEMAPEDLVKASAAARKPIVVSIRRQFAERGSISTKQQWVLAYWCYEHDMRHS